MKKFFLMIAAGLLLSNIVIAQQDSTALIQPGKSIQPKIKSYSDSSGKYAPYGKDSTRTNINKSSHSKSRGKRDKTDSVNPADK